MIGIVVYFFFAAGLMGVNAGDEGAGTSCIMFSCALSFLAGIFINDVVQKLSDISKTLFSSGDQDRWR